jgi:hypothetical protein
MTEPTIAELILEYDESYPGNEESEVVVPAEVWAEWVDQAGQEVQERTDSPSPKLRT